MKINAIKPNLRQFLTDKIKTQKINLQNIPILNQNNNFIKQLNSHTNSNKNIGKFSLLNSIKDKDNKKNINSNNDINNNMNYNFNNNSFYKENQNDCNKFRKSKTSEKISGNNILIDHQESKNKNKKIMLKQNIGKKKKYNLSISKIPKYDNSAFNQVIKYYTIKSESKTIQIEELSAYLRPIRNALGFANKIKTQNNKNSSININNHYNNKKFIINYNYTNNTNSINKEEKEEKSEDIKEDKKEEKIEDKKELNNSKANDDKKIEDKDEDKNSINEVKIDSKNNVDNENNMTFGKNKNVQIKNNNLCKNKNINDIDTSNLNNANNQLNNKINSSLIKNCVFNNVAHTQTSNKFSPVPFNIKIDKIKNININDIKNLITFNNNNDDKKNTNNNVINSKNMSEIDTQISTNNNVSNNKAKESLAFYQFRPRNINLPKSGINLSSMQFKNKILQNILSKRKQNK